MSTSSRPASGEDKHIKQAHDCSQPKSWLEYFSFHDRLDEDVCKRHYVGSGTHKDPYVINFLPNDYQDPRRFRDGRKWTIAMIQAFSFFTVTFGSSVYASGIPQVIRHFHVSEEVATLGLSLYVLGFAVGPILWAPMSEVYGRKLTFVVSYTAYVAFTVAAPLTHNIATLMVLRFLAGAFGASAQTNPGGMIADMFNKEERGPVTGVFAACPFLGPALGPIVGGFVGQKEGWRWILGVNAILSGVVYIAAMVVTSETYAIVILQSRARALSQMTGSVYVSQLNVGGPPKTLSQEMSIAFTRPWILLVREPIVLLTGIYVAIIYATLYLFFAAIPIVFQGSRHWSQGLAGLPFVGVAIGVCFAVMHCGVEAKAYKRLSEEATMAGRSVEPEARLHGSMVGAIVLPIGLFLFAWTTYPSVHWIASVIGATLFAWGNVMVFISLISYLVDSYTVYVGSALAANTVLRSFFATAFPLFTSRMYAKLGNQWASSIPAFLVVGCLPMPFLFYRYGHRIRSKCKFAAEAARIQEMMDSHHTAMDSEQVQPKESA